MEVVSSSQITVKELDVLTRHQMHLNACSLVVSERFKSHPSMADVRAKSKTSAVHVMTKEEKRSIKQNAQAEKLTGTACR